MICQECRNLIQYKNGMGQYGCQCKYNMTIQNYIECSHFSQKTNSIEAKK